MCGESKPGSMANRRLPGCATPIPRSPITPGRARPGDGQRAAHGVAPTGGRGVEFCRSPLCGSLRDACPAAQQPNHQAHDAGDDQCEGEDCSIEVDRSGTGQIGGLSATNARTRTSATAIPRHRRMAASSRLSVRSCRTRRIRPAPSAARMGEFTAGPARARCEQKIRHIHTYDQQYQADGAKESPAEPVSRPESGRPEAD